MCFLLSWVVLLEEQPFFFGPERDNLSSPGGPVCGLRVADLIDGVAADVDVHADLAGQDLDGIVDPFSLGNQVYKPWTLGLARRVLLGASLA